jgi:acyl-CoA thioester hydrolase
MTGGEAPMPSQPLSLEQLRALPAPLPCRVRQVEPQWIDHNGHLNMAYYNVMLDDAVGDLFRPIGFGPNYRKTRNCSTMTAECHVRYLREIKLGDPVQVFIRLLGADEKRMHLFEEMRHATEGWLATTSENISLHIDMSVRRVAPFPPDIAERVQAVVQAHSVLPRPEGAGRSIGLPTKSLAV